MANVILRWHTMITLDTPNEYQTALIHFIEDEASGQKSNSKVEIGMSSVPLPNMADPFTAKIFMNDDVPVLILNEEWGILATISGVYKETNE